MNENTIALILICCVAHPVLGAGQAVPNPSHEKNLRTSDLEAPAKLLGEVTGGDWQIRRSLFVDFQWVESSFVREDKHGAHYVLPFGLDKAGRQKLAPFVEGNSTGLSVLGHNEQWTLAGAGFATEREDTTTTAKLLRALGIERTRVVVNGLSVAISADKGYPDPTGHNLFSHRGRAVFRHRGQVEALLPPGYQPGEPAKIEVTFRNHTDQDFRLAPTILCAGLPLPIRLVEGKTELSISTNEIVVPARDVHVLWVILHTKTFEEEVTWGPPFFSARTELKEGEHSIRLLLDYPESDRYWSGTVRSNRLTFEVAAAPSSTREDER